MICPRSVSSQWLRVTFFIACAVILCLITATLNWNSVPPRAVLSTPRDGGNFAVQISYATSWILPFRRSSNTKRVSSPSDFINCVHKPLTQDPEAQFKSASEVEGFHFAYVWYASSQEYLCSALIALQMLLEHRSDLKNVTYSVDFVVVYVDSHVQSMAFKSLLEEWEHLGGTTKNMRSLAKFAKGKITFYKPTYQKFHAFQLVQYQRVIFMDGDGFALHDLDHLFLLRFPPDVHLAAPQGYWFRDKGVVLGTASKCQGSPVVAVTTVLMVIEPSLTLFKRVRRHFGSVKVDTGKPNFDMDIVIKEFSCPDDILILPKHYGTIDSEYNEEEPLFTITEPCRNLDNVQFLHLTSEGKPWTRTHDENRRMYSSKITKGIRPIFQDWFKRAEATCPDVLHF